MKKVFMIIALVVAFALQSEAQRVNVPPTVMLSSTYSATSDTVTSTAAKYLVSAILPATQDLRVAVVVTEISGTTAGTISLEGSIDGSVWFTLTRHNSDSAVSSFSLTDVASQTVSWNLFNPNFRYVRVKSVGINTPNFRVQAKVYGVARQ